MSNGTILNCDCSLMIFKVDELVCDDRIASKGIVHNFVHACWPCVLTCPIHNTFYVHCDRRVYQRIGYKPGFMEHIRKYKPAFGIRQIHQRKIETESEATYLNHLLKHRADDPVEVGGALTNLVALQLFALRNQGLFSIFDNGVCPLYCLDFCNFLPKIIYKLEGIEDQFDADEAEERKADEDAPALPRAEGESSSTSIDTVSVEGSSEGIKDTVTG